MAGVDTDPLDLGSLSAGVGERRDEGELERPHDLAVGLGHQQELVGVGVDRLEGPPVGGGQLPTLGMNGPWLSGGRGRTSHEDFA